MRSIWGHLACSASGTWCDSRGCAVQGQELDFDTPCGSLLTQDILQFYGSILQTLPQIHRGGWAAHIAPECQTVPFFSRLPDQFLPCLAAWRVCSLFIYLSRISHAVSCASTFLKAHILVSERFLQNNKNIVGLLKCHQMTTARIYLSFLINLYSREMP